MAITVGNISSSTAGSGAGPFTYAHNNNGNFLMVIVAYRDNANNTITVTYNGDSLTSIHGNVISSGSVLEAEIFYILSPASGSNTVSVSSSGSIGDVIGSGAISLSGVNEADPFGATAADGQTPGGVGGENPRSTNIITDTANSLIIDVISDRSAGLTVGGSQTQIFKVGSGDNMAGSYRTTTSAGTYAMEWTPTESGEDWSQAIIEVHEEVAATGIASMRQLVGHGQGTR